MKPARRDVEWIESEDDDFVGVNLGWDFTAEHEWGIEDLRTGLRRADEGIGLDRRTLHPTDKDRSRVYMAWDDDAGYGRFGFPARKAKSVPWRYAADFADIGIAPYWSKSGFCILYKEDAQDRIRELHKALWQENLCLFLSGKSLETPLSNRGLVLAIKDRVPPNKASAMKDADMKTEALRKAHEATGIEERLEEAGRGTLALSPRFVHDAPVDRDTEHEVVYWLNPRDQQANEAGWYTVEELEAWARGEGPVIKEAGG